MRRFWQIFIGALFGMLCLTSAGLADASEITSVRTNRAPPIPNVLGLWTAVKHDAIYWHRDTTSEHTGRFSLEFESQNGPLVEGVVHWDNDPEKGPGHDGASETHRAYQPMIGTLGYDGETLHLVQHPDGGYLSGRFLNTDTLEIIYAEDGPHAVVGRFILIRQNALRGQ
ncbi:hypothetical protein [Pseudovibrio exalbescens]|uniref:Lipocalin-like domain-containing protein n=1 Tax=Pseudovibrio exalbescens TaxID=197461 RepID=A0A1U7JHP9_9HYPH|nr:hypothetical protein [Pseudovibrio exalbescens]OKL44270.1 hypothetical protein A3843_07620 [Pseudovibrio exalbescens]